MTTAELDRLETLTGAAASAWEKHGEERCSQPGALEAFRRELAELDALLAKAIAELRASPAGRPPT